MRLISLFLKRNGDSVIRENLNLQKIKHIFKQIGNLNTLMFPYTDQLNPRALRMSRPILLQKREAMGDWCSNLCVQFSKLKRQLQKLQTYTLTCIVLTLRHSLLSKIIHGQTENRTITTVNQLGSSLTKMLQLLLFFAMFIRQVSQGNVVELVQLNECLTRHLRMSDAKLLNNLGICILCDSLGRQISNLLIEWLYPKYAS